MDRPSTEMTMTRKLTLTLALATICAANAAYAQWGADRNLACYDKPCGSLQGDCAHPCQCMPLLFPPRGNCESW